ncbi:uncharacterized protein LOC116189589 isoform X2 [Punica granatum]|uniref:Uncharacterized protein LOC116189589 isoform X2 n=1 Tax=Punica granatum TaxID=22663 RepID=A0A218XDB6_PUNGR|nr:uncharacterized protein LOC116189589 isoform X2 [Punica granatum]OWM82933.1 hypothetical protein CDL15_Pgr005333 [Punica granatum]
MCGRARCALRPDDVPWACHRGGASVRTINMERYRPLYNVAPGWNMPVLRMDDEASDGDVVVLQCMNWGLIPSFTKKTEKPDHFKMFNARSESIKEKASFRRLIPKCRCLVVVEGFYEWKKDGSKKQPYYIHFKDERPLVFAALYDSWVNSEGETLYTFTILTTSSSPALQWLHDRMPVILGDKEATDMWLTGASSNVQAVLKPYEGSNLAWYPVTPAMGKLSFDGPECIKEIQLKTEEKNSISKFFSPKQAKKEPEIKQEEETSPRKSVKVELPENVKVEPETEAFDHPPVPECKPSLTKIPEDLQEDHKVKRDYKEVAADSDNATTEESEKHHRSPVKKKKTRETKGTGDKQSTLFSYFGKS